MPADSPPASSRVSQFCLALILGVVVLAHLSISWQSVAPFDGPYADGPYQLFNALRRMDDGERPGRDFPAFHGLGVPVLHYPVFATLGHDLIASELSRQLVSRCCSIATYLVVSWIFTRRLWPGALWSVVFSDLYPEFLRLKGVAFLASGGPGNSMLGLRSLVPLLFVALVYQSKAGWRGAAILGVAITGAFLMGVEQSIALAGGALVTGLAAGIMRRTQNNAWDPPLCQAVVVGVCLIALTLLVWGGDRALSILKFFFVKIPADQVWYFGVPPNRFLGDGTFYAQAVGAALVILALGFGAAWVVLLGMARRTADPTRAKAAIATAVGLAYAALALTSNLGTINGSYLFVPVRMAAILATLWAYWFVIRSQRCARWRDALLKSPAARGGAYAVLALWAVWAVGRLEMPGTMGIAAHIEAETSELSRFVQVQCPAPKTGDVWSTYAGYLEAKLEILHPEVDYVIHALGDDRETYIQHFAERQPPFVQTLRRDVFLYEAWLESTTWGFYDRLLANYQIVDLTNHSILWQRVDRPWIEPADDWTVVPLGPEQGEVAVPAGPSDADIAVVQVEYEMANPLRPVPILGSQGRILVKATGGKAPYEISLPPRQTRWEFPVLLKRGAPFTLQFEIKGLSAGALTLKGLRVRYLTVPSANEAYLAPARFAGGNDR